MRIEEEHPDVLQNIEFAVATLYRKHSDMTDYSVMRTLEALIDFYSAERAGRKPKPAVNSALESTLFDHTRTMCEWRLGRRPLNDQDKPEPPATIDLDTLIACLKRLQKSVNKWNKHGGRQGYLQFMSQFVK